MANFVTEWPEKRYNKGTIERLSLLVKREDGSFVEIFANKEESQRVWDRVWNSINLAGGGSWLEEKVEVEKN